MSQLDTSNITRAIDELNENIDSHIKNNTLYERLGEIVMQLNELPTNDPKLRGEIFGRIEGMNDTLTNNFHGYHHMEEKLINIKGNLFVLRDESTVFNQVLKSQRLSLIRAKDYAVATAPYYHEHRGMLMATYNILGEIIDFHRYSPLQGL